MNRSSAAEAKVEALKAIECLSRVLQTAKNGYGDNEFFALHKEVGVLIGKIQMGILEPIYTEFPELDDLN